MVLLPLFRLFINYVLQLIQAHDSELRSLALTADGTKLATASVKGTVIRVWDVASSTCVQEFRRGVERTTITCLAWSSNHQYLACTSDKGTAHVFAMEDSGGDIQQQQHSSTNGHHHYNNHKSTSKSSSATSSFTQMLFATVRKSMEGDARKSICQIRGLPHPQACAFVADTSNLVAIAGWDADGNGVLLISECIPGDEPKRISYHVICKSALPEESDEARRRRRLRGWIPEIPSNTVSEGTPPRRRGSVDCMSGNDWRC